MEVHFCFLVCVRLLCESDIATPMAWLRETCLKTGIIFAIPFADNSGKDITQLTFKACHFLLLMNTLWYCFLKKIMVEAELSHSLTQKCQKCLVSEPTNVTMWAWHSQSMIVCCSLLTPYLHWREEAPYWKRHCSSASYTCPGATVGYRKSCFRGSLSRHVPRPELSKKQTFNGIGFSTEVSSVSNKRKKVLWQNLTWKGKERHIVNGN